MMGIKLFFVLSVFAASAVAGSNRVLRKGANPKFPEGGSPQRLGEVVYPCATTDFTCIGEYLAQQASCDPENVNADFDSFTVSFKRVYLPGFNVSEYRYDTTYSGISSGVVEDFYVNEETGKVVLTLQFPSLSYRSASRDVNYYLPGTEPYTVSTGGYTTTLEGLSITIIFECASDLELSTADIYTYIPNLPTFVSEDDNISTAAKSNAQVAAVNARYSSFRGIPILESQYLRAPEIVTQFVNGKICKYETPATVPDRRSLSEKCAK